MFVMALLSEKCGTARKIHVSLSATCARLNPSKRIENMTVYIATPKKMNNTDIFVKPLAALENINAEM